MSTVTYPKMPGASPVNRMTGGFATGTLTDSTPFAVQMLGAQIPSSVTLNSAAAGRLIEISTNGGVSYFPTTATLTATNNLMVALTYPVTHVRFTGQANDTFYVV